MHNPQAGSRGFVNGVSTLWPLLSVPLTVCTDTPKLDFERLAAIRNRSTYRWFCMARQVLSAVDIRTAIGTGILCQSQRRHRTETPSPNALKPISLHILMPATRVCMVPAGDRYEGGA